MRLAATILAVALLGACSSDGSPAPTVEDFVTELEAACAVTAATIDAIASPDEIGAAAFATQAGQAWADEAERLRDIEPPDELDADHRALIRNDEEQASAWNDLAAATGATGTATITELTTTIAQLNLGRSDLVVEMGAPRCARTAG